MYQHPDKELLYILPTYSQFDYAQMCVESLVRTTPTGTYYVAVIDDGSPDWDSSCYVKWPACPRTFQRFLQHDGLTRSWNAGLSLARDYGFKYAVCGNSDLLFTEGWYEPLKAALEDYALVGPVTNAPGHAEWQNLRHYHQFKLTDDISYLNQLAQAVRNHQRAAVPCKFINGFCMMAKTETWWHGAFDQHHVFDPRCKLTGNEDELQKRWVKLGLRIACVPRSFVFHYRSVSRELTKLAPNRGAFRHECLSRNDCLHANEHGKLVDAGLAKC
jgi:GT2 family glycosyltransferase